MVGFLLALGPFDHVVVSALHLLFGILLPDGVSVCDLAQNIALATAGNLVGGLTLVTFSHTAQVRVPAADRRGPTTPV
jgi:formate/nitrite transporter FocA (FNT family)